MTEMLREIVTERADVQSVQDALDDHGIHPTKIVAVLPVEAQLAGEPGRPPRLRVLYRSENGSE